MAERQRTRRAAVAERPPAVRRRAADEPRHAPRRRRPVAEEPESAEDELEVPEEEPEPAEDELEVPEEEPEPAEDELEAEPVEDEDEEDEVAAAPSANANANGGRRARGRSGSALTARQAVRAALQQIAELTAKQPEDITGLQRTDDGWAICFEVVEDHRIPSSSDILATYEATIDAEGQLVSYRRTRRYARGRGDSSGGD